MCKYFYLFNAFPDQPLNSLFNVCNAFFFYSYAINVHAFHSWKSASKYTTYQMALTDRRKKTNIKLTPAHKYRSRLTQEIAAREGNELERNLSQSNTKTAAKELKKNW